MDAKRCDRCKKFYLESDNVEKRPHKIFNIQALDRSWNRLIAFGICTDCANAFVSWIKMGESDDGTN